MTPPDPFAELGPTARELVATMPLLVSVSGGKDSTACCLWLLDQGLPFSCVFMDTGWEHEDTYAYLDQLELYLGQKIDCIQGEHGGFEQLALRKGMFPSRTKRFCTEELKVRPFASYVRRFNGNVVNVVGIRRAESGPRSAALAFESQRFDLGGEVATECYVWRPLVEWSERDVIEIHQRHGLKPNPLYLRGAARVGCWPCIFARKGEIRFIAEHDPKRIERVRQLEAAVAARAEARHAAKGETFESLGYMRPTLFQARLKKHPLRMWPIDMVVEWSKTDLGRETEEVSEQAGCFRWGMCEPPVPLRRRRTHLGARRRRRRAA